MHQNKISLLSVLKDSHLPFRVEFEHVLLILLNSSVTLQEARRYLNTHPLSNDLHWSEMRDQQIEDISKEAQKFIKKTRQVWRQEGNKYSQQLQQISKIKLTVLPLLELADNENAVEVIAALQLKLQERKELLKIHMNTEAESSIQQENQNISLLIQLLRDTSAYKRKIQQQHLTKLTDQEDLNYIEGFLKQNKGKLQAQQQKKRQTKRRAVFDKMQDYERKVILLKKRLYQIFLFYCRENKSAGLTFQEYGRSSQLIDLRLFLKYFKDYQYVETNKYRFKVTTATQLFRNAATNGLSLSFQQFWSVHRQLFELKDLPITRRDIIEAETQKLPELQNEWEQEIAKLKELNQIVSEQKTRQLLKFVTIKTESSSPQKVNIKNSSSLMAASKVTSNRSSKYLPKKAFSDMESKLLSSKHFIQRVRAEIQNVEEQTPRAKIDRSNSLSTLSPLTRGAALQVSLPKILKLSTEQLSSQNIYQSLKRFSDEDYRNQQKKLRDLIGLSRGEEDNLMKHFLSREREQKQQKKRERSLQRQLKRKKLLEDLAKKQHHCKKLDPKEIQPYMRF